MDGIFAVVGLIGSVWNLATGSILPAIYNKAGLNVQTAQALGYSTSNIYEILYNEQYFRRICGVLILASVAGATLNVLPYFFYDLTETKQEGMIAILKIRAMLEDHENDRLTNETLAEGVALIEEAEENEGKAPMTLPDKRKDRSGYKQAKKYNRRLEISDMVLQEIRYFETPQAQPFVERAHRLVQAGVEGFDSRMDTSLAQAKALPNGTPQEKEYRKSWIEIARAEFSSAKLLRKHYPNGVEPFDETSFDRLFAREDEIDAALTDAYARKDKLEAAALRAEKKHIAQQIRSMTKEYARYNRAVKPYQDAKKLLKKKDSLAKLDELRALHAAQDKAGA